MKYTIILIFINSWLFGLNACNSNTLDKMENKIDTLTAKHNNGSFDLKTAKNGTPPSIKLNSGYPMPIIGLGTYSLTGETCVNAILSAIKLGYRKFDTASIYANEREVGEAIRKSGIPREEFFITTKLYPNQFANATKAIEESLEKLNIGYVDLMLLHHPASNDVEAYKAMEKAVKTGKIRSLGLSNYYIKEMTNFLPKINIKPALVQNEIHPYYQDTEVIDFMHKQDIVVEAWYPLGGRGYNKELLTDPVIEEIAKSHQKSIPQVILRWDLQRGVVIVPGSSNPNHQQENISLFDFELTKEEMEKIKSLHRNQKHDWY